MILSATQQQRLVEAANQRAMRVEWYTGVSRLPLTRIAALLRHPLATQYIGMSYDEFCEATKDMTTEELLQQLREVRSAK